MSYRLPKASSEELADLAALQDPDVEDLLAAAVRQFLDAEAITDLEPLQVGTAQVALLAEFPALER